MKLLLPLLTLVAVSGGAFAQEAPASATVATAPMVPSTPIFKDVPPTHWAFNAVQRLAAAGIIEGYPSTAEPATRVVAQVVPAKVELPKAVKVVPAKVVQPKMAKAVGKK